MIDELGPIGVSGVPDANTFTTPSHRDKERYALQGLNVFESRAIKALGEFTVGVQAAQARSGPDSSGTDAILVVENNNLEETLPSGLIEKEIANVLDIGQTVIAQWREKALLTPVTSVIDRPGLTPHTHQYDSHGLLQALFIASQRKKEGKMRIAQIHDIVRQDTGWETNPQYIRDMADYFATKSFYGRLYVSRPDLRTVIDEMTKPR